MVSAEEVFEVPRLRVIYGAARVHALDDRSHVTEHQGVHERADEHRDHREDLLGVCVRRHVAETDARQARAGEVEGADVRATLGRHIGFVEYRLLQLLRQLIQPTCEGRFRDISSQY